jgi:hypothetical protein
MRYMVKKDVSIDDEAQREREKNKDERRMSWNPERFGA